MSKSTTWKRHERRVARAVGGKRNGATGLATSDVETPELAIECKCWASGAKRVEAALQQAEDAAKDGQLPLAVIHTVGRQSRNDLCVLRWADMQKLIPGMNQ